MSPELYVFYSLITFIWIDFLWDQYLTLRQMRVHKTADSVFAKLDKEAFNKTKSFGVDTYRFILAEKWFNIILSTSFLYSNGFIKMWNLSKYVLIKTQFEENEIMVSCVFVLLMITVDTLMSVPFSAYGQFVIEEKYGFNKKTLRLFVKDIITHLLFVQVTFLPFTAAAISITKLGGRFVFIWIWVFYEISSFVILTTYPDFIAPLLDKFTLLPDGSLKAKIEKLAEQVNFPLNKIYIVEESIFPAHSYAYIMGIFNKKRIIILDTLLKDNANTGKRLDEEEIVAVLGHELGHWKLYHLLFEDIIHQVNVFMMLLVFGWLYNSSTFYRAFGLYESVHPVIIGLAILHQYVFIPYRHVLKFAMVKLRRKFEFQADAFVKKLGKAKALENGLIKLDNSKLGFPIYDSLYSAWHKDHPELQERLEAISKTD